MASDYQIAPTFRILQMKDKFTFLVENLSTAGFSRPDLSHAYNKLTIEGVVNGSTGSIEFIIRF